MSIAKGFPEAALKAADFYKTSAMQIFTKSPRMVKSKPLNKAAAKEFKQICQTKKITFVVSHCSYLLNFAKILPANHWSILNIIDDLERIFALGGAGTVLHVGKYLEQDYKTAQKHLVKNLKLVLKKTKKLNNFIIIENTAGQGTEMGKNWEELSSLYEALGRHHRIKFCLDTQHSFAAGYDWRDEQKMKKAFKKFNKLIGLKNLVCIHFNDSLKDFNCRVDRHQNIGLGYIGAKPLKNIAKFAVKHSIPLLIETPEKNRPHEEDLDIIKKWF